jgi:hypothetical protein
MINQERNNLATVRSVIETQGGEVAFWMAWINGDLDAEFMNWFRDQVGGDPGLEADLRSIEQQAGGRFSTQTARAIARAALEASTYLTEVTVRRAPGVPLPRPGEEMTEVALREPVQVSGRQAPERHRVRQMVKPSLFQLLEEVEIHVPDHQAQSVGRELLAELVGAERVQYFRQLNEQLQTWRAQAAVEATALYRVLRQLVPELFSTEGNCPRYQLSFRLFLKERLKRYCRRQGWAPAGPRFYDLMSAFDALSREGIGVVVRRAEDQDEPVPPDWAEGLQLAAAEFV